MRDKLILFCSHLAVHSHIFLTFVILQLYASQVILPHEHAVSVRSYAKEAAPSKLPPLKGDGKQIKWMFFY